MYPSKTFSWSLLAGFASFSCLPVFAKESEQELEQLVIVETRSPRTLSETSPWVTAFSAEDLRNRQIHFVSDALRNMGGVSMARLGGIGSQTSLFSRGSNSDHVTFLLEGRRLNGGFSGYYNLGQLSLAGLTGVEMLRGPSSTLYGGEGIGGAVMLRAGDLQPIDDHSSNVSLSGGSFETLGTELNLGMKRGKGRGSFGASLLETENEMPNADFSNRSGLFTWDQALDEFWSIDLIGFGYDSSQGLPGNVDDPAHPRLSDFQDTSQFLLSPGLSGKGDDWRFQGFYSRSEDRLESTTSGNWGVAHNDFQTASDQVELQYEHEFGESLRALAGVSYFRQEFLKTNLVTERIEVDDGWSNRASFGLIGFNPYERLEILLGGRAESYSDFGSPETWTFAAHFDPNDFLRLHGRVATGYAPPTAADLYGGSSRHDVDPEESRSREIGLSLGRGEPWQVRLTCFQNDFRNLIEWSDPDGDFVWTPFNLGKAESSGVETNFNFSVSSFWSLLCSYSYLDAIDESDGSRLLRRPRHTGSIGFVGMDELTCVGGEVRFSADLMDYDQSTWSEVSGEDFVVARLYASRRFADKLLCFARVENLFDEEYAEADGYPALGIGVFGGFRYSF